jgi:hypothetical protein
MDFSRYPLERLVYFAASVIPGSAIVLILYLKAPLVLQLLFWNAFLGYKTKVAIGLVAVFAIGYSLTTFLGMILGGIGGALGKTKWFASRSQIQRDGDIAPWRDPRWRTVLASYLGPNAPSPTPEFMTQKVYDLRLKMLEGFPNPQQRQNAINGLNNERLQSQMADLKWEQWYEHFHKRVLEPSDREWFVHIKRGLNPNFETAGLVVLIAAFFIPGFQHWWVLGPAGAWTFLLIAEELNSLQNVMNQWMSLSKQIKYFLEDQPGSQSASAAAAGH